MLELYRSALAIRRSEPALGDGAMNWLPADDGVLAFDRGSSVRCVVNISGEPARLPRHCGLLLASGPLDGELLPPDSAIWLRLTPRENLD
jgi:alpha-glucosidase